MKVEGINSGSTVAQTAKQIRSQKGGLVLETTTPETLEAPESSEDHGGGVIELLKQGHFKGVADVRLRINFFDELQSLENQGMDIPAAAGLQTFNQSIEESITLLQESDELTEEKLVAFNLFLENMKGIQHDFVQSDELLIGNLINNLQGEFDTLLPFFTHPTPEVPAVTQEPNSETQMSETINQEEAAITDPLFQESTSVEGAFNQEQDEMMPENNLFDIFTSFKEAFQQALKDLRANLSDSPEVLPLIAEPSGNGKAFEKFMAIYENMKNSNSNELPLIDELETA